jgi:hypothetical protein
MFPSGHSPYQSWLVALLLAAASPLVLNVALFEVARITSAPMSNAVLHSGFKFNYSSFITVMRVLNGLLLGTVIAFTFGLPLGLAAKSRITTSFLVFVVGVLVASLIWHSFQPWGVAGFTDQWSVPEMWLSLIGVGAVATVTFMALAPRK